MHVGNLRTALYAYLIAKHEGGDFILRIEDTDQERYVEGAVDIIYRTLQKTGLVHDEGPDKDGGVGPYAVSYTHLDVYKRQSRFWAFPGTHLWESGWLQMCSHPRWLPGSIRSMETLI